MLLGDPAVAAFVGASRAKGPGVGSGTGTVVYAETPPVHEAKEARRWRSLSLAAGCRKKEMIKRGIG